jgi:hypothetical protein
MANGLTRATPEDAFIQKRRHDRATLRGLLSGSLFQLRRAQECVGWSIGRGYEADYLESIQIRDRMLLDAWFRSRRGNDLPALLHVAVAPEPLG